MTAVTAYRYRVFVDTNILINDYLFRAEGRSNSQLAASALVYLRSKPKVNLYIASFSLVQLVSTLSRHKVSDDLIRQELRRVLDKYIIATFPLADLQTGIGIVSTDVEDSFQYAVCQKLKCGYILTDNVRDFRLFSDVVVVSARKVRQIAMF